MTVKIRPKQIELYINSAKKTLAAIKKETGCTHIMNAGFYDMYTFKPVGLLIKDTVPIVKDWGCEGMGFDEDGEVTFSWSVHSPHRNFIYAVPLVSEGKARAKLDYDSGMGDSRGRTAWGYTADGTQVLYCDKRGRTPEELRDYMYGIGCQYAVMLDGGDSTQCDFNGEKVTSSRKVHNFILFWADGQTKEEKEVLSKGSKGDAVKTLQTSLNKLSFQLDVDGDFGTATHNAVIVFQSATGLEADGIVGAQTEAMLKRCVGYAESNNKFVAKAAEQIGTTEPKGDDKFITAYNEATGAGFSANVSWCQIFIWWVLAYFDIKGQPATASCTAAMRHYIEQGAWHEKDYTPKVGDLVYFDWDKSGDCDHVGFVAEITGNEIYTIEGNSTAPGFDGVCLKRYALTNSNIRGYAEIKETASPILGKFTIYFTNKLDAESFRNEMRNKYPSMEVE